MRTNFISKDVNKLYLYLKYRLIRPIKVDYRMAFGSDDSGISNNFKIYVNLFKDSR